MRTLEAQILPGHDGVLPARHAGPATRSLQRSKYFLASAKYFLYLEILYLPHGTGLAADGLGHGGLCVLHVVPARALQLEVKLLALVTLQPVHTCRYQHNVHPGKYHKNERILCINIISYAA